MPTTNPVPSTDPSDLLFNAGKLDEVVNGTANSFTDRLGVTRRTVAGMNADFDAQLADAESDLNVYRADAAASAAEALGYLQTIRATSYGAYASDPATDPLGNPPTVGDEYFNTTANLLKRWNGTTWQASDINTANLAATSGASLVGYDGGTVQDVLDGAKSMQDYAALRAYTGRATRVYITGLLVTAKPSGIAGVFQYDPTDTTSADNGGTIIVDALGRRWKRQFEGGTVNAGWFGIKSDPAYDNSNEFRAAIAYVCSLSSQIEGTGFFKLAPELFIPNGYYRVAQKGVFSCARPAMAGFQIRGAGKANTVIFYDYTPAVGETNAELLLNSGTAWNAFAKISSINLIGNGSNDCWTVKSQAGSPQDFIFEDVWFDKFVNATTVRYGTSNADAAFIRFIRCDFNRISGWIFGIPDAGTSQSIIHSFTDCKLFISGYGVYMKSGGVIAINGGNWIILGNGRAFHFEDTTGAGIGTANNVIKISDIHFEWQPGTSFSGASNNYPLLYSKSIAKVFFDSCELDQFTAPSGFTYYDMVYAELGCMIKFENTDIPAMMGININGAASYTNPQVLFESSKLARDVASFVTVGGAASISSVGYYPLISANNCTGPTNEPRDVEINARGLRANAPRAKRFTWAQSPVLNFGLPTITTVGDIEKVVSFKLPKHSTLKRIILRRKSLGTSSSITLSVKSWDRGITFVTDTRTPISGDANVDSGLLDYFVASEDQRTILLIATGDVYSNGVPGYIEVEYV